MNWRVYTSHHTRHFSKRQRLPGDCFSPLIEDHTPKYIDFNSCDSGLLYVGSAQNGEVELRRIFSPVTDSPMTQVCGVTQFPVASPHLDDCLYFWNLFR